MSGTGAQQAVAARTMVPISALRAAIVSDRANMLRAELSSWSARTRRGNDLEKHHTQIARLSQLILCFLDMPASSTPPDAAVGMASAGRVLAAGRLWAFFRSKLALREVALFAGELRCADELAWECYRPARDMAVAARTIALSERTEPPLVYFTSDDSPSARSRGDAVSPDGLTSDDTRLLTMERLRLPIPLVGLPWIQRGHVPAMATLAHEVGHAVERDCRLGAELVAIFANLDAPEDRRLGWAAWRREIFADAYGILCLGLAAPLALTEYLAADPEVVRDERRSSNNWQTYPPATLRMLLNCALLAECKLTDGGLRARWLETYPERHSTMIDFEEDLDAVAKALYRTKLAAFGGKTLPEVISFRPDDLTRTEQLVERIFKGHALGAMPMRLLFAAATLAYHQDPQAYAQRGADADLVQRIVSTIPKGVRGGNEDLGRSDQAAMSAGDARLAEELLAILV